MICLILYTFNVLILITIQPKNSTRKINIYIFRDSHASPFRDLTRSPVAQKKIHIFNEAKIFFVRSINVGAVSESDVGNNILLQPPFTVPDDIHWSHPGHSLQPILRYLIYLTDENKNNLYIFPKIQLIKSPVY